jgi:hypothetical protein
MKSSARILCLIGLLAPWAQASGQQSPREPQAVHWAATLGMRVAQVNAAFPIVDQVVLVPDEATYIEELSRWSPRGRWPVLFADDLLAPMFIRRFEPAHVLRREPGAGGAGATSVTRQQLEAVVVRAWGGDPQNQTWREAFDQHGYTPPGVVITTVRDPAWTAGVALAAGRGQPFGWLDEPFGRPNQTLEPDELARLQNAVDGLVAGTGYPHAALGDAIDAITLCRSVGGRVDLAAPGAEPETRAVTDVLGRTGSGPRYAFTGWIFGDRTRCAYVAMCSLFLPRDHYLLVNTYPAEGAWQAYDIDDAATTLSARGYQVETRRGERAGVQAWFGMLPGGIGDDVVAMNSKGNVNFFDLYNGRVSCGDVPVLNVPAAIHLIHSWSMRSPDSPATVAGRWLQHGAYAFVGSVDEPTLSAFLPPRVLAGRWASGVPWLIGARRWDDSPAWKVNTFGDPLMLSRPGGAAARPRLAPAVEEGQDLKTRVKTLMRQADAADSSADFAAAIATLTLLGEDALAVRMWQLAVERGHTGAVSRRALGPLFRLRRTDEFIRAWEETDQRDPLAADMLWQLMSPRLRTAGEQELLVLAAAIRPDQPDADLERLAPYLTAAFGAPRTRDIIQREIDRAERPGTRKRLQQLLRK